MSDTIHLACVDCRKRLWVGQGGYSAPTKAYLYGDDEARANFTRFYDEHRGHDMRFGDTNSIMDIADRLGVEFEEEADDAPHERVGKRNSLPG